MDAGHITWAFGVPVILMGMFVLLVLLVLVTISIVRALVKRQDQARLSSEETQQLRRLWQSMDRMEGRIANLEALLLEKEPHDRTYGSGESWKP